ncbi:MAG: SIS domain-containing protein [Patescibacteria group bacterium]
MKDLIESQLAYVPEVIGAPVVAPVFIVGGMGGSALPALILRFLGASAYIIVHRGYGMPDVVPAGASFVAISYSGNTEETLSFANEALARGVPLSVITSGGALLSLAQERSLPHVLVPQGMQPRDAILATARALRALMGEPQLLPPASLSLLEDAEQAASTLAPLLAGSTPIFYTSLRNEALGYLAKILCNETAKMPAFSNVFPELNHNEMQGFGARDPGLLQPFVAVFLRDPGDDARTARRMDLTEQLLAERGVRTVRLDLPSSSRLETFLYGWTVMRTATRSLAESAGVVADEVALIESFKAQL